jgi:transposase
MTQPQDNTAAAILHLALELGEKYWKVASTRGLAQTPRLRQVRSRDLPALLEEIERARKRFGLPAEGRVVCCYEAGMEGFWLYRALEAAGIETLVVDSSSIDVKRRRRRAKTDRLDAAALVRKLVQYVAGDMWVWSVVRVPAPEAEDARHTERELERLTDEQTALRNGIRGLLKTQGIRLERLSRLPEQLETVRLWDGRPLPPELRRRLERMWERLLLIQRQMAEVEERQRELAAGDTPVAAKARQLSLLRSVGPRTSWMLSTEVFGWRSFRNRRQLAGLVGLVPVPDQSGEQYREHGISKTGRARLRGNLIELSWLWLRYQPQSALSQWYERRYAGGGKRLRRIGIVAMARKLLVELWKYVETGALPEGAVTKA